MWLSTLEAMDAELVSDSLVYRYNPERLTGRAARLRGHVLAVHVLATWTRWPGPAGSTRRG